MKQAEKALAKFLTKVTEISGQPVVFALMVLVIAVWFIAGIFFRYDDTWFNILDVFVFLVTFFLVFVVQSTQNADTKAMQDKLDEIIDKLPGADTSKEGEEEDLKRGNKGDVLHDAAARHTDAE